MAGKLTADWRTARSFAAAGAALTLPVMVYAWPLLSRLTTALPGTAQDHDVATFVWNVTWVRHALDSGANLMFTDQVLIPYGADLRIHTYGLLQGLMAYPFTGWLGDLGAFNLMLVVTLWLNAVLMWVLAYEETGHRWPAVVAGLAFALSGPILMQFRVGRPSFGALWIACAALLAARRLFARPSAWTGALLGLCLAAALLTDFQIVYFTVLWLAAYLIFRLARDRRHVLTRPHLGGWAVAAIVPAVLFFVLNYPSLASRLDRYPLPSLDDMRAYSFQVRYYLAPQLIPLYSSYVLVVGALAALIYGRRGRDRFWLLAAAVFFVLALGPYLEPTRAPLPTAWMGTLWPPLRQFRTPSRMTMPAQIGLAVVTAGVLGQGRRRLGRSWGLAATGLAGMVVLGHALWREPFPVQLYPHYDTYARIGAETGDFALLEVPVGVRSGLSRIGAGGEILQFYYGQHGKRLINGMVARLPVEVFDGYRVHCSLLFLSGEPADRGCDLASDFGAVLTWLEVRYVLVHGLLLEARQAQAIEAFLNGQPQLALDTTEADLVVYRVRDIEPGD